MSVETDPSVRIKVVVDTSALVPAIYGLKPLAEYLLCGTLVLIWNIYIIDEAIEIIERYHAKRGIKLGISLDEAFEVLYCIKDLGIQVSDMPEDYPAITNDRDDDPFLWASVEGEAEYIISCNTKHFPQEYEGIPVGEPKDFFEWAEDNYPMIDTYNYQYKQ